MKPKSAASERRRRASREEIEFTEAMERYRQENRRPFPTWSEVLEVLRSLGYRRVAEPTDLPGRGSGVVAAPGTNTPPPVGVKG